MNCCICKKTIGKNENHSYTHWLNLSGYGHIKKRFCNQCLATRDAEIELIHVEENRREIIVNALREKRQVEYALMCSSNQETHK